ncbi:MAG: DNA mismatch repair protein MutT [Candidatus Kerfeldbacteria bacterium CG15_BIG_FIL_POST_REV_8_21_14_020_45_12]|uniref:DNA mismatch repair protein MutT n=1 Tax=Candidatus Kerfeldbacteria bacterium CG15_BIG_FIL_POST_REV_8_21_14_020_45_12 TaxID=2014247 RepID=A0A2M7H2U1_9BACT|nr:MAG: DNA mismatch repair protein MutT [Candidatus Kerfeldbacteria bacterium CG15_BIG_FIL_POST_REV_8_21_14_020_45_12]PJA93261.1 MAG: DNA mismatch repair protein MutT [Candidatus Kerfeldbacteria bacterium CG_4_9_14_3_um_filter_45_8]
MSNDYHLPRVAAGALILNNVGEVLLLLRSKNCRNDQGLWSLPGGKLEFGERLTDAVRREVKEEVDLELIKIKQIGYVDHILDDGSQHWVPQIFLCTQFIGTARNVEPDKCDELGWFSLDSIPEERSQVLTDAISLYTDL